MLKKQVIQYNSKSDGFKQNVIGLNQSYSNQQMTTVYGGVLNDVNKIYEVKEDQEDEEQIQKKQVDDQMKFNTRNPIEYQNELKVQEILEQKAKQQLMNLCGGWDQQIRRKIMLELDIVPEPLLGLFKIIFVLTLVDLLWITFSNLCMPTAAMHFIEGYVTTNIRWQMFIYWCSNLLQWTCLVLMLAKLTIIMCRATIISIILNLAWHIGNFVFYNLFISSRQSKFPISNPLVYWIENIISIFLLLSCIILYFRLDNFVKTNPDRDLVLNKNMEDIIKEQYILNNQNLPISQIDQKQQGGIIQAIQQSVEPSLAASAYGGIRKEVSYIKNNIPVSQRSLQQIVQNNNIREKRETQSKMMNNSFLNETDTNFLNQTNGNLNYTGINSQQFLEQDKSLIIDDIPNEKTAILSIYHQDWRTHYGEYAPDQKKRKIIDSQMVKLLENDLKESRKMKLKGSIEKSYSYFDLHFIKQRTHRKNTLQFSPSQKSTIQHSPHHSSTIQYSPNHKSTIQQSPNHKSTIQQSPNYKSTIQQSPNYKSTILLSPTQSQGQIALNSPGKQQNNQFCFRLSQVPSNQEFDFQSVQNQTILQNQHIKQQQNTFPNLINQNNINQHSINKSPNIQNTLQDPPRSGSMQVNQFQQNFQSNSQFLPSLNNSPNVQFLKSRGQSLSFYGETSIGFNQLNKQLNLQNANEQNEDAQYDNQNNPNFTKTQNQFINKQGQQINQSISTTQYNVNSPKRSKSQQKQQKQEDYESEYFKTKAIVGDQNLSRKKKWGIPPGQKRKSNAQTFDNIINQ